MTSSGSPDKLSREKPVAGSGTDRTAGRPPPEGARTVRRQLAKAEDALHESERRYETLIGNLSGFVYRCRNDSRWTMEYISEGCKPITGYAPEDLVENRRVAFGDLVHPDYRKWLWQVWQERLQQRAVFESEYPIIAADGETRWLWERGRGVFSETGVLLFLEGFITDVTERKRAEDALRQERRQLLSIFDSIEQPIYVADPQTHEVLFVNRVLAGQLGRDPVGDICYRAFQGFDAPCPFCTNQKILEIKPESYHWEHHNAKLDRTYAIYDRIIRWPDGRDVRLELAIDISDRKRAEDALARERNLLRVVIDNLPDAIYAKDRQCRKMLLNRVDLENIGLPESQILGHCDADLFPPDVAEQFLADDRQVLDTGIPVLNREEYLVSRSGKRFWQQTSKLPLTNNAGEIIGLVGIGRDITERKQAEEERQQLQAQLLQAQKLESVGRLAGGVAHDFNNMLGIILGHVEMLLERAQPDQPYVADLHEIRAAAERSAALTRQLLAFASRQVATPEVLDLNSTIATMLLMLRRLIGEDIDLVWAPHADLWPVRIDPGQIDQILTNLCVNARDAIDGIGRINIETGTLVVDAGEADARSDVEPGDYVMLSVSDDGCGMDRKTREQAFDPFFTTKDVGKGTGLGLATVYGIVQQNGGHIHLYSEPGQGTVFKMYLPRYAGDPAAGADEAVWAPAGRGTETVLLVEDEPEFLRMISRMLEYLGYRVLSAESPTAAVDLATRHDGEIHLLMTDVIMPEMNGRELAGRVKSVYPGMRTLFMSGYPDEVITRHGMLDRGTRFIQKPFAMADLAARLRDILEQGGQDAVS